MQEPQRLIGTTLSVDDGGGARAVTASYGFGLVVEEDSRLGRTVSHSGGYPGFGSHMRWHPTSGWGVIVLGQPHLRPGLPGRPPPSSPSLVTRQLEQAVAGRSSPSCGRGRARRWTSSSGCSRRGTTRWPTPGSPSTSTSTGPARSGVPPSPRRARSSAAFRAVEGSVRSSSPSRAMWLVAGDGGPGYARGAADARVAAADPEPSRWGSGRLPPSAAEGHGRITARRV